MSKPTLSHTTDDGPNSLTASSSRQGASDSAAANIQVVIRCRHRSDCEVQENSSIVVSSDAAKSIEASVPLSSLGVVTLPPSRTYPSDFPMLDQVLMGYNCTLFAYSQTGTGKTCLLLFLHAVAIMRWSFKTGIQCKETSPLLQRETHPPMPARYLACFSDFFTN
jgi:hypothetical protein